VEDDVLVLPLLVLVLVASTVALGAVATRHSPPSRERAVAAARTHALRTTVAAIALGLAAAVYVGVAQLGNSSAGGLGITGILVLVTFGAVHTLVLGIGELTWPRPDGEVRRARLAHRGLLDAAPRRLVHAAAVAAGLTVVTLVTGALMADADGRHFAWSSGDYGGIAGPFPGLFYGLPAALGLGVLAALTAGVLWIVANRPAVATADERIEAALRRASAHRVLRVAAGVPLFVDGGLLFVGGNALHSAASSSGGAAFLGPVGACVAALGIVSMLAGVVVCCIPAPSVPADAPAVPVP
jgi:hypothetical protein